MKQNKLSRTIAILLIIYLLVPIFFTFMYSIATKWQDTVIPEGLTMAHYAKLLSDPRYFMALGRTLLASIITIIISFAVLIPVIYVGKIHFRWLDRILGILTMMPFALQGVILAVGLIKVYSGGPLQISGTIYILVGAYFVVILPYMYQGIKNSIDNLDAKTLLEAASLLGASEFYTFVKVILPNMIKGVTISVLLSFAILIGEFVLSNMLVGGNFETVQVFMYWSRGLSGHYSSAIVISYFTFVLLISGMVLFLNRSGSNNRRKS